MDRSTPNRRLERVERSSPYSRPNQSKIKKSSSLASFSSVKSLISYALTPFRQGPTLPQHTSDLTMDDVASEDGSEDDWDGEPPKMMEGQDVFDLAAAGGREGKHFEARTEEFRSRGEVPGGRREVARRQLQLLGTSSLPPAESDGFPIPGQYNPIRPSPSMPVLPSANSSGPASFLLRGQTTPFAGSSTSLANNKRPRSPPATSTPLPARPPIPASWQNTIQPSTSLASTLSGSTSGGGNITSASSAALAAFLKGKEGQSMTEEDFRVIDTLTHNMRSETLPPSPARTGGWGASASRPVRALPSSTFAPSIPAATPSRPGQTFSLGATPPRASPGPLNPNRHQVTYLGPGMSPNRLLGKSRSSLGLKPLLDFSPPVSDDADESAKKKRKTESDRDGLQVQISTTTTAPPTPEPLASFSRDEKGKGKADNVSIRLSPLNQSFTAPILPSATTAKTDAVKLGKQRAADIMKSLIEQDIQNVETASVATPAKEKDKSFVIYNPYDNGDRERIVSAATPSTPKAGSRTPAKSILRSSVGTPLRGAAARLEESRKSMTGKQMSTLEKLGVKTNKKAKNNGDENGDPQGTPLASSKHVRIETPTRERDMSEVESLFTESQSSTPAPEPKPAATNGSGPTTTRPRKLSGTSPRQPSPLRQSFTLQDDEIPIEPFEVPTFTSASQIPLPIGTSSTTSRFTFNSPSQDATLASVTKTVDKPVFEPSIPSLPTQIDEDPKLDIARTSTTTSQKPFDPKAIYLSAKDSALNVDKAALPFYTFTVPLHSTTEQKGSEGAKKAALVATLGEYTFFLPDPTKALSITKAVPSSTTQTGGGEWTCSLCMLKNPASALEKCGICEAKRPATAVAEAHGAKNVPFQWPGKKDGEKSKDAGGEWTCSMCMLKNPGSAVAECTICKEPRK